MNGRFAFHEKVMYIAEALCVSSEEIEKLAIGSHGACRGILRVNTKGFPCPPCSLGLRLREGCRGTGLCRS